MQNLSSLGRNDELTIAHLDHMLVPAVEYQAHVTTITVKEKENRSENCSCKM